MAPLRCFGGDVVVQPGAIAQHIENNDGVDDDKVDSKEDGNAITTNGSTTIVDRRP
jgi:hypothetical protein